MVRIRDPMDFEVEGEELASVPYQDIAGELRWPWESADERNERISNEILAQIAKQQIAGGSTSQPSAMTTVASSFRYIPMALAVVIVIYGTAKVLENATLLKGAGQVVKRLL